MGIPKLGIPKTGISKTGMPKVGKTDTGTLPKTEIPKARDSEDRDSGSAKQGFRRRRDSESRDSEDGDSENGQIQGSLNSDTLRLPLSLGSSGRVSNCRFCPLSTKPSQSQSLESLSQTSVRKEFPQQERHVFAISFAKPFAIASELIFAALHSQLFLWDLVAKIR